MVLPTRIAGLLPLAVVALCCASAPDSTGEVAELEPVLVGPLSRAGIEAAVPGWVTTEIESRPDPGEAAAMAEAGSADSRVTVYLGTWCSDSRRELARFWRALDDAGGEVAFDIGYVGVNRDKSEPAEALAGLDLQYVPTFVVEIGGVEVGRIVEESPNGIEHDLAALLRGEVSGLVTAKEELLGPRAAE